MTTAKEIATALAAPFPESEIKLKSKLVKDNRALVIHYIDARAVQERLDVVFGIDGWQDEYQVLPDGCVQCQLRVKIGDLWVVKSDVGSPSDQSDGGDRMKAAYSDALKRVAVKFGVARDLYRRPAIWMDYDPVKKRIVVPAGGNGHAASPTPPPAPKSLPAPAAPAPAPNGNGHANGNGQSSGNGVGPTMPKSGKELYRRLATLDEQLTAAGKCRSRELVHFVRDEGEKAGYSGIICDWNGHKAIEFAVETVKRFLEQRAA